MHQAVGILFMVIGVALFMFALTFARKAKLISSKATRQIGSTNGGFVELKGTVVALQALTSPYSGQTCVYYRYAVEEYVTTTSGRGMNRRSSGRWKTLRSGAEERPFLLDDGTRLARIEPKGAEIILNADASARSGTFNNPTADLERFLQSIGVSSTGFFGGNKQIRVRETFLSPGDALYVLGSSRPNRSQADGAKLVVAEDPQAPAYLLSDKGEEGLVASLKSSMYGYGAGSFVVFFLGLAILLYRPKLF